MSTIRVLLAGNPNCGKTSLFNALTGAHQHVGNYPGVTVEKRTGHLVHEGDRLEVTDLPGLYSLASFSPEERISQDVLLEGEHDVVVLVVDSMVLRRALVLLAQVMHLGANPVLCLNMTDEAEAAGLRLDLPAMRVLLGVPVVQTVGHRGQGVDGLVAAIRHAAQHPAEGKRLVLGADLDRALTAVHRYLGDDWPERVRPWIAVRLLVGDEVHLERVQGRKALLDEVARQRKSLEATTRMDVTQFVTGRYFGFVDGLLREVVLEDLKPDARATSNAIDRILVHPVWGLPMFGLMMFLVFWGTFTIGELPMAWIEAGFLMLGDAIGGLWPEGSPSLLRSVLVDGVVAGVGGVLVFLPNILLLFLGLSLLEDTGYMARAAFLMDRVMHRFGLHGKSFLPMLTGFGCTIPGIMATRTLENERDRLTTLLVLPLMSCGARLPIWMLLVPAFFPPLWRAPVLWGIYVFGVMLALSLALLLRKTLLSGEEVPFVMELPPYRLPTLRSVATHMAERAWLYIRKAGTTILAVSVLLWVATSFPRMAPDDPASVKCMGQPEACLGAARLESSYAGQVGKLLEPALAPLGFDWKIATGMVGAFAAKEVFVAQMGIVYALGDRDDTDGLGAALARDYQPIVGVSLILFLLIGTPCVATVAVTRREAGGWRWAFLQLGGLTALAWLVSFVTYQIGSRLL